MFPLYIFLGFFVFYLCDEQPQGQDCKMVYSYHQIKCTTDLTCHRSYAWEKEYSAIEDWVRVEEELKTDRWTWYQEEKV